MSVPCLCAMNRCAARYPSGHCGYRRHSGLGTPAWIKGCGFFRFDPTARTSQLCCQCRGRTRECSCYRWTCRRRGAKRGPRSAGVVRSPASVLLVTQRVSARNANTTATGRVTARLSAPSIFSRYTSEEPVTYEHHSGHSLDGTGECVLSSRTEPRPTTWQCWPRGV